MSNRHLSLASRLLRIFLGLLLGVLAMEAVVRQLHPRAGASFLYHTPNFTPSQLYQADVVLGYLPRPGFSGEFSTLEYQTQVRINSLGLRGPELKTKAPDEHRILTLGDSFVIATQVSEEDSFQAHLAQGLQERWNTPVTVLNSGVDGYGTIQAGIRMEQLAETAEIDEALFFFFLGNDLHENCIYPGELETRRRIQAEARPPLPDLPSMGPVPAFFHRYSMLVAYIQVLRERRALTKHHAPALQRYRRELELFSRGDSLARRLHCTRNSLEDLAVRCERLGLGCSVALFPPPYLLDPEKLKATFELVGLDPEETQAEAPAEALASLLEGTFSFLDLGPALSEGAEDLFFRYDGHWNPRGHEVVGAQLVEFYAQRGAITPPQ